jgi:hypothetical protein
VTARDVRGALGSWLVGDVVAAHGLDPEVARRVVLQVIRAARDDVVAAAARVSADRRKLPPHQDFADAMRLVATRFEHAADRLRRGEPGADA